MCVFIADGDTEDEIEEFTTSADFLVELCGVISQVMVYHLLC